MDDMSTGIPTAGESGPRSSSRPWPFWARFVQLIVGLVLFGLSAALLVRGDLGLDPWDVFHQGLARATNMAIGTWIIIVGGAVLLLWIPLRMRPGIGTVCNVILIGLSLNLILDVMPVPHTLPVRWACLLGGIVLCGIATGLYIGASMGPGPRDGLMVGIANRGHSIRVVRTAIELAVLVTGFLLGGTVGIGTVLFAVGIGPIAHLTIPAFARTPAARRPRVRRGRALSVVPAQGEPECASG
jgi:uncharacterized membrane protein YczE